ncbi:hypothetical protein FLONG3_6461 [Fusarium longipes]|uniref:Uncharacterized protein n=1 Tax=Fusarium longipes TaxID=694270 RepID=A0A395SM43_9HYPO|nr:hypothetical protein FLONG3_6461 [Fusarium longipes]
MRVFSVALAILLADTVVEAGVCKPQHTTTLSVGSSATTSTETLTESFEISITQSLTSSTETPVYSSIETLVSSSVLTETTSTGVVSATITEETSTTINGVTSTTITTASGPSATPGSIVGTGPVADLTLHGANTRFNPLSFVPSDSTQTLIFTIVNGQLSTGNNNNYLCLQYKTAGTLGPFVLCPFDNFQAAPLKCARSSTGTLVCTAPNGSCDASGSCRRPNNAEPFSQFYVDSNQAAFFGPATGDFAGYTAVDLILAE